MKTSRSIRTTVTIMAGGLVRFAQNIRDTPIGIDVLRRKTDLGRRSTRLPR